MSNVKGEQKEARVVGRDNNVLKVTQKFCHAKLHQRFTVPKRIVGIDLELARTEQVMLNFFLNFYYIGRHMIVWCSEDFESKPVEWEELRNEERDLKSWIQ